MDWNQWVTPGLAVLGAGLGVFNTAINFRRDRIRLKVSGFVQKGEDGVRRLRIKLVNTGRIAVTIEKVFLTGTRSEKPKAWQLWEHRQENPSLPKMLKEGERALLVIHRDAVDRPLMHQCFTVMAQTADGRNIKGRSTGLRELAVEAEMAAAVSEHMSKPG